jgi:hypothetical protein
MIGQRPCRNNKTILYVVANNTLQGTSRQRGFPEFILAVQVQG